MTTMQDIVDGGYKRLGLIQLNESPTAAEANEGNLALNDMMHGWKAKGVDISHTTKALTDTFPLGAEFDGGVKAMLAVRLAEENGLPITPQLLSSAKSCWRDLQAAYITAPENVAIDPALRTTPSQRIGDADIINNT